MSDVIPPYRCPESGPTASGESARFVPILLLLFVGSGCSALIYEIVWFQLLLLVIGSSSVSLGVLLGTFMGGMCLGSVGFSHVVSSRCHSLRVYAALELGIGAIGVALLFVLPYVGQLYVDYVGGGVSGVFFRVAVCAVCLLPPTVLMGATLPAIARWVKTTPDGISRLGFFYGANIAGAVFGCLLAGFYLLRLHDVEVATCVAAAINAGVAVCALALAFVAGHRPADREASQSALATEPRRCLVYVVIALSGMSALGAEVIWTRLLSLMLGATVYTFSIILAVFLVGLGIGSSVGAVLARGRHPCAALGFCQLLLAGAIAWAAYALTRLLPYWPIDMSLSTSPWMGFQLDLTRCVWAILPAACLWGASFPLALAAAASAGQDPGRLVGGVYAANTVGAIGGALLFSMLAISWLGTQRAQQVLIGIAGVAALLMLGPRLRRFPQPHVNAAWQPRRILVAVGLVGACGFVAPLVCSVPAVPAGLIGYGRWLPTYTELPKFLYVGEGRNAAIAVSKWRNGVRNFHVSGKVVASSEPPDMRLQRMLCHLPALIHPRPESVLVVGCGAGVTAGSFLVHPDIERVVICEIEPLIPPAAGKYFDLENYGVMRDPCVELVYDDARHYILTSKEKFDIITSDPIHPWVKGAAALYSEEYFELCKQHLKPGGVVTQWVPLYETTLPAVQSQISTFFRIFPNGTVWSNDIDGRGYDVILLGQCEATRIGSNKLQRRLDRADHLLVVESMREVRLGSARRLLNTYAGQASDLRTWLKDAEVNRDRNLKLQYLAGIGLNSDEPEEIYKTLLAFRRPAAGFFADTDVHEPAVPTAAQPSKAGD